MNDDLAGKRERIMFAETGADFVSHCREIRQSLLHDASEGLAERQKCARTAAELAIDLRSFLIQWKLMPLVKDGQMTIADLEAEADAFLSLAGDLGDEAISNGAVKEIESIRNSSMRRMSELQLEGTINTVWGHDYASGITHSLRRGALFSTNNPAKNTLFKKDCPDEYQKILDEIARDYADASLEDRVSMILVKICARNARPLRPIFDVTHGRYGFICIQVDPFNIPNPDSTEKIIQQVHYYHEAFKRELKTDTPNIVYKIPAVERALQAAEVLAGEGFRLCVTLNFTVAQHEAFARIISEARVPGFVVLMGGLLDDKVTLDLKNQGNDQALEIGRHAAQAVIRKSYANLHAKGYDQYASIMTAAVRGPWAIANTLAPMSGAQSYITTLTAKINEFDQSPMPLESKMDEPVDPTILDALMKSPVFRKAYATLDEQPWNWDELFEFPPFVAFYDQFRDAYAELTEDMRSVHVS